VVVAKVFHSTFPVRRHLSVDRLVTRDEQTAALVVERFSCWPRKYVACSVLCALLLKNSRSSFRACWFRLNELWELTKCLLWTTFVFRLAFWFLELTPSVQRAALREAWGALALGDPLSSSLTHYENMWSLVGAGNSLENADR
jgi:hypothetical protein